MSYSACDWSYAGSPEAGAKIRARIIPSRDTLDAIERRNIWINDEIAKEEAKTQGVVNGQVKKHPAKEVNDAVPLNTTDAGNSNEFEPSTLTNDIQEEPQIDENIKMLGESNHSHHQSSLSLFDKAFGQPRSWLSHSIYFVPGTYYVFADVEYDVPYIQARKASLPRDLDEAPWLEPGIAVLRNARIKPFITTSFDDDSTVDDRSEQTLNSLAKLEKQIFKQQKFHSAYQAMLQDELDLQLDHHIWMQCSSLENIELTPVLATNVLSELEVPEPLLPSEINEDTWPFVVESQSEVSSRELMDAMTIARAEAENLADEFIDLAKKYKEVRKELLYRK